MNSMNLRDMVIQYRKSHHLTQHELASRDTTGTLKLHTISKIERVYSYRPSAAVIKGLSLALHKPIEEIIEAATYSAQQKNDGE
ncbi:helix-turn-helix domain-containing protein [Weissella confusa]|uniref:helix-turn-helix transcriptional regulator n=1 Tax=Weissella confusa TaxID=1583 RepID=UPI001C6F8950|nr:helix-turn-helix transcriptional regulator [Weissella confusa]QYU56869.1 helix-turn-helix domain-containing protein [Weissella confusa]